MISHCTRIPKNQSFRTCILFTNFGFILLSSFHRRLLPFFNEFIHSRRCILNRLFLLFSFFFNFHPANSQKYRTLKAGTKSSEACAVSLFVFFSFNINHRLYLCFICLNHVQIKHKTGARLF